MNIILSAIGNFFSQGALDQRLVPASQSSKAQSVIKRSKPSRWGTLEFRFYLLVFLVVIPLMFKTAAEASNETNQNYWIYQRILSNGWINGRKVDNSDAQYRFFRNNIPMLAALMGIHVVLKKAVLAKIKSVDALKFDMYFGLVFLFGAHGFNSLRIILHCAISYLLGKYIKNRKLAMALTWAYGVSTLFANDKWRAIPFGSITPAFAVLDSFRGIIERWDVFFNFTLLRMLSFNLDYLRRCNDLDTKSAKEDTKKDVPLEDVGGDSGSELQNAMEKHLGEPLSPELTSSTAKSKPKYLNDRERLDAPLELSDYNLCNYISYLTYTPLFIAGPILTFNDYVYQSRNTSPTITRKSVTIYALRFIVCLLTMEFILHYIYVVAVSKAKAWHNDTPFQISMIGLFNLNIIWLKLLIPWRLFRLWSLMDNIDPPENMIRCMNNNNSAIAFWRAWHRSFSRWSIRYIHVPLGGERNRIVSSLCVFSFVAIWHDIQLKLLIWGWLVVLFLLPEILISKYFTRFEDKWWYRHVCCMGSVVNIWMMMIANLFGFCLGPDGSKDFLTKLFGSLDGFKFFIVSSACLFVAVQVQNELRETEKRRGIDVRC